MIALLLLLIGCPQTLPSGTDPGPIELVPAQDDDDATGAQWDDDDATEAQWDDDDATDAPANDDDAVQDRDEAVVVGASFPAELEPGEAATATVTITNTGTTTWTRDEGYKLGAVDDEDPLYDSDRVWLDGADVVPPGGEHTFAFEIVGPEEGTFTSDWQMVREGVYWFGESVARTVDVVEPPDPGPPPLDLNTVVWLHVNVSSWPVTSTLSSVTASGSNLCMDYDMANVWPIGDINGTAVVGNPWIFIWENNQWYGATWEWLRPGQTCKAMSSVAGDHIKVAPFDAASGWTPTSGETYYFMVSALARFSHIANVQERTEPVPFVWP